MQPSSNCQFLTRKATHCHQRPVFPRHGGDSSSAGIPISRHLEAHLRRPCVVGLYDVCWPTAYRGHPASCCSSWSVVICCDVLPADVWWSLLFSMTNCSIKLLQTLITFYTRFCRRHPMHPNTTVLDNAHIHCSCLHIPLTSLTVILLHAWCIKTVI